VTSVKGKDVAVDNNWVLFSRKNAIAAIAARPEDVSSLEGVVDALTAQVKAGDTRLQGSVNELSNQFNMLSNTTAEQIKGISASLPVGVIEQNRQDIVELKKMDVTLQQTIETKSGLSLAQANQRAVELLTSTTHQNIENALFSANASAAAGIAALRNEISMELLGLALKADNLNQTDILNLISADLSSTQDLVVTLEAKLNAELKRLGDEVDQAIQAAAASLAQNLTQYATETDVFIMELQQRLEEAEKKLETHATSDELARARSALDLQIQQVDQRDSVGTLFQSTQTTETSLQQLRKEFDQLAQCVRDGLVYSDGGCQPTPAPSFSDPDADTASQHSLVAIAIGVIGMLLAVVALAVAVRAKRGGTASVALHSRSATFENPMYDHAARASKARNAATARTDEDGLYDEPRAFMTDGAMDEGGYMDVSPTH
jgi:hypothetical protein